MLQNYFKLALKVLARRKFFTFISLFGISFTLMILMLIAAFLENELGNNAPLSKKDQMIFIPRLIMTLEVIDTVPTVDSTLLDGIMRYDTTYEYVDRRPSFSSSSVSFPFLDKHMRSLDGAQRESFYSTGNTFDLFINSNKLSFSAIYADANYWSIYDFNFREGRPFQAQQVENQEQVIVLTEKAARSYFGKTTGVVGEILKLDNKSYEVVGVVKTPETNRSTVGADVFLPYTHVNPRSLNTEEFQGGFQGVYLSSNKAGLKRIKAEIARRAGQITLPDPENYNTLNPVAMTFMERYAQGVLYKEDPSKSVRMVFGLVTGLLLLFVLLPTLNLVNVNISRIIERSSEIGVRKAFGAHSGNILFQFVFENIVLTFLGGIIGFVLALVLINIINDSNVLGEVNLGFNFIVFIYSLLICLFFGIVSGLIPAYRMSKIHIADALKQNQA